MISHCHGKKLGPPVQRFPLAMAGEGEQVQIAGVSGGSKLHERLLAMGIKPEDTVEVVQRGEKGAVLIAKGSGRFALGGGMAHKIYVTKV